MKLHELKPNAGSRKNRKRVGRGPGGTDKTAGRGHKGQKSRSGAGKGSFFEGGRSRLIARLPKRGFNNVGVTFEVVNLAQLANIEDATIDRNVLELAGLVRRKNRPVKLLGSGDIARAVTIHVDAASEGAVKAVEAAGGKVILPEANEAEKAE
ncbi:MULTISPECIES: 50S ribosomal protein L15 [Deinococcus]|jgi:large subunit ribosomal protein L15|uniref:Large ribosomal subunit protein uL15 n=5 Tax=Deinococcus TaxID=1298 RepID=A0A0F7JP85_9DEIO|nr:MULTISPECIES: 50S ribosomal protein L15 [Deinococcus]AKH16623.1 50S ribosomal protein L15 [Deinococcus soli (ex Cha et al. 2016)]MDK2013399.1 50S ribosomal protein L15 [Deinococcus sp. 43]MDR6217124.1 large subunit ribosomal protein L15 [Deinococcus soli (ex Cha et al. 2016)]MDR6327945.1 large subunit ribosomal protein L15 [Deinococcus soli (ex Cha et al. 2016)]MDR6750220.1 large subunit ribosomal protein L15 [Deinococcus soli (ex Cha et al. 2016)]